MRSIRNIAPLLLCLLLTVFSACEGPEKPEGYEELEKNYYIKLVQKGNEMRLAKFGKYMIMHCQIFDDRDSLISFPLIGNDFNIELAQDSSVRKGFSLMRAFNMLAEGDSVLIILPGDSVAAQPYLPKVITDKLDSLEKVNIHIRVLKVFSPEEYRDMIEQKPLEDKAFAMKVLENYLEANQIDAEPVGSGLRIIYMERGKGKKPSLGQKVKIHVSGRLFSGQSIINTFDSGVPLETELLSSDIMPPGLAEAITYMKPGDKIMVILPYYSAFGEKGLPPDIPPYSHLEYEVKLLEVL